MKIAGSKIHVSQSRKSLRTREQVGELATNATEELVDGIVVHALDAQLLLDQATKLGLCNGKSVLDVLARELVLEEGLEPCKKEKRKKSKCVLKKKKAAHTLGELAVHNGGGSAEGLCRVLKLGEGLELDPKRERRG